jgi:acyl carrier protein
MTILLDRILAILEEKTDVKIDPDEPFGHLPIDSITMAELVVQVEKEFKIRADERMLEVGSVRELAELIERLIAAGPKR